MFLHQRSRVNWLKSGDRNSAFFHATLIQRRQWNQLVKLQNEDGQWLSTDEAINSHLHDYFSHLFTSIPSRNFDHLLSTVQRPNAAVSESPSRRWSPPGLGHFKLNCDASFTKDGSKASLAIILCNWEGQLVDGRTSIVHVSSTLQGEARTVRMACAFFQTLNLSQVSVEGDNKTVIELSVSELVPSWDYMAIIHDIRSTKSWSNISFSWSPRSSNRVAHWVASRNLTGMLPLDWVAYPPLALGVILSLDSL
ncbi:hypothetical protein ACSBR1_005074 [Camellia fascicularis]